jgi:acetylornithine/succinyldiaminopimelate/putrescine aminotransferase
LIVEDLTTLSLMLHEHVAGLLKLLLNLIRDIRIIGLLMAITVVQQTMKDVIDTLHLSLVLIASTSLALLILLHLENRSWCLYADKVFDSPVLFLLGIV